MLGVIGGIGGGKTQVSKLLSERGAVVFLADSVGHELLRDRDVRARIVDRFGTEVLEPACRSEGAIAAVDRGALGRIVFQDAAARRDLEAIVHPLMRRRFEEMVARAVEGGADSSPLYVVLDAAILFEAGWDDLCDLIVFVDAPRHTRLGRVRDERGWSEETLGARERVQLSNEEKRRRADFVITNDSGLDQLGAEVDRLLEFLDTIGPPADRALQSGVRGRSLAGPAPAPHLETPPRLAP